MIKIWTIREGGEIENKLRIDKIRRRMLGWIIASFERRKGKCSVLIEAVVV